MGMVAILIFNPPLTEGSRRNLKKIGLGVSEEKLIKGVDGWQTDGRWTKSDHNSSSWAFGSGELKIGRLNKSAVIPQQTI